MAVKLRLRKIGSNKDPFYRIIAADVRSANGGSFLEELGWYDPVRSKKGEVCFKLDLAKADEWIKKGAQPSETVVSLMRRARKA
ncbi:MAG: 30S ribosomal protein S16 [Kiritimatiellae bacterium]|nr:30S ribosomal protein S16 [Kiritimatiellia bacterium]MBQ9345531.1 30S ribosomal protein S16 [Kiritimatiellia bacterium]